MAGLIGALGGNSAKTDRGNFLTGQHQLNSIYSNAFPFAQQQEKVGTATAAQGTQDLGTAGSFWKQILGGNRAATAQAIAPQANAINAASDAQARELASSGTARGGGTASIEQQRQSDKMAAIDNMLFGARTGAAGRVADIGRTEAGVGLDQTGQGLGALNIGREAAANLGQQSLASRELSQKLHNDKVQGIISGIGDILSMGMDFGAGTSGGGGLSGGINAAL